MQRIAHILILFLFPMGIPLFAEDQTSEYEQYYEQYYQEDPEQQQPQPEQPQPEYEYEQPVEEQGQEQTPNQGEQLYDQQTYEEQWKAYEEQQADAWRQFYRLPSPPVKIDNSFAQSSPGISITVPTGFGPNWGDLFGGMIYRMGTPVERTSDGIAYAGMGIGDGRNLIGASLVVVVTDLIGSPFADGSSSIKIHKQLTDTLGVALGAVGHINWGENSATPGFYATATKLLFLKKNQSAWFNTLTVSAGAGYGPYIKIADIVLGEEGFGFFVGTSIRINRPFSFIVNFINENLDFAISWAPFASFPLTLTAGINQLLHSGFIAGSDVPAQNRLPFISGSIGLSLEPTQSFAF